MTIQRAFATIIVTAVLFAITGAAIGWLIGEVAPGYYHAVFARPDEGTLNAKEVGTALGLTQGLIVGAIVGGFVTVAQAIYFVRKKRFGLTKRTTDATSRSVPPRFAVFDQRPLNSGLRFSMNAVTPSK